MDDKTKKEILGAIKDFSEKTNSRLDALTGLLVQETSRLDKSIYLGQSDVRRFRDEILTRLDKVMGEVLAMRQEQAGHQAQHEDLEMRVGKIEKTPVVASQLRKKSVL